MTMLKTFMISILLVSIGCNPTKSASIDTKTNESAKEIAVNKLMDMNLKTLESKDFKLSEQKGAKVFLVVNTASKCGYTGQYEGLEALYKKFKDKGLVVIGFPSNDFGAQEPGSNEEIKSFCKLNFGVSFPLMDKAPVKGAEKQNFYKELLSQSETKDEVAWNFEKFLFTSDAKVFKRYKSSVKPSELETEIAGLL